MEGKKVLGVEMVALMLLTSLLVASARHPFAGLPLLGKGLPKSGLVCCDNCDCGDESSCTCGDSMEGDCADGCGACDCVNGLCWCRDMLSSCPDPCDSDYIVDKSPAANKGHADHGKTSD